MKLVKFSAAKMSHERAGLIETSVSATGRPDGSSLLFLEKGSVSVWLCFLGVSLGAWKGVGSDVRVAESKVRTGEY